MAQNELSEYTPNELLQYEHALNNKLLKVCDNNTCTSCEYSTMCNTWLDIYETLIERGYEQLLKEKYRRWLYVHIQNIKLTD